MPWLIQEIGKYSTIEALFEADRRTSTGLGRNLVIRHFEWLYYKKIFNFEPPIPQNLANKSIFEYKSTPFPNKNTPNLDTRWCRDWGFNVRVGFHPSFWLRLLRSRLGRVWTSSSLRSLFPQSSPWQWLSKLIIAHLCPSLGRFY